MMSHDARPLSGLVRAGLVLVTLVLLAGVGACAKEKSETSDAGMSPAHRETAVPTATMASASQARPVSPSAASGAMGAGSEVATSGAAHGAAFGAAVDIDRKLIRDVRVNLIELEDAEATISKLEVIAREANGFIGASRLEQRPDGGHTGEVTLRVPAARFGEILREVRALGTVRDTNLTTQDVTDQYVDLEARIVNSDREEKELLRLYERGGDLAQIIQIETKLSEVRERIEIYRGQLRLLASQVDLSTITVGVYEIGGAPPPPKLDRYEPGYHVKRAYRTMVGILQGILTTLIYVLIAGWVVWLPLAIVICIVVKRNRREALAKEARHPVFSGGDEGQTQAEGEHEGS